MARSAAARSDGFEWRTLLQNNWPIPTAKLSPTAQQRTLVECCELCGEAIGDGRPFTTNSAGQRAMHMACLGNQEPTCVEQRPPG
jgi:hypothetical protein